MNRGAGVRWRGILAVLFFLPGGLSAQLAAGSWMADISGSYRYAYLRLSDQSLHEYTIRADFHFFALSRLAPGARLSNDFVALNNDFFQSSGLVFSIEPNLRYYVWKGRLPAFLQGGLYWQREEFSQSFGSDDNAVAEGRGFSLAAGANLFALNGACLEGLLEYRYRELGGARQPGQQQLIQRSLGLGVRLRAWLSEESAGAETQGPGLDAVQSGGWMAGGTAGGALLFGQPGRYDVALTGGIFLVNRLSLGLSLGVAGSPNAGEGIEHVFSRSAEPFLRYYLPVADNLLLFPALGYALGKSESITSFGFESFTFNTWRMGMGLDNFLSENLALELIFSLSGRNVSPTTSAAARDFDLSFGLSVGVMGFW